ncbi:glycyl aminopeptidase/ M61 family [Synechococcus sp. RS9909]|uniref:M61 family metallopeptidase n=1 Tax=unclassified Synechococcus TaxID=2626047 RepID=UPI000068F790|nr:MULTISPECIES: PDZ domain-containing protein [unclassified Synechococcus]EAQ69285.1 PDZ domain (also known as DHR or GLGF) [Synechococcus sp. RS9917]QNI79462.1 glycyl aminopeptidase/ M61 family [Synechococcus sp. RS9909]
MSAAPVVTLRLDLRDAASQTLCVEQSWFPRHDQAQWQLPIWTPGSYTVRDPVQHLHSLSLRQGDQVLTPQRCSPSRWSATVEPGLPLHLSYQLEARQLTVRTCYLDPDFASLCLSAVAMLVEGERWSEHRLQLQLPGEWQAHVPLPLASGWYCAEHFDALVDSPVHAGPFPAQPFEVEGCRHELVLIGAPPQGWPTTLLADIEAVCTATCRLMAEPPAAGDRYQLVIQMLEQGYGGLEHDHGAVLQFSWSALASESGYHELLQLVGHEYLHQWNVRRLRPKEYVPYDHGAAVLSDGLWFAEGVTSYYDLALPLLAGRSDGDQLLKDLGRDLSRVLLSPGLQMQSLADSSREAWVRLYKRTPAAADSQISYYLLGAALAFCLDVHLRQAESSLAEVLRDLWSRLGRCGRGYGRADIQAQIARVSPQLAASLPGWLDHRGTMPIEACVQAIGLRLEPVRSDQDDTGLQLRQDREMVVVERVRRHSPGHGAGLVPGDELVAVRGRRLRTLEQWPQLLRGDDAVPIVLARRGVVATATLIKAEPPLDHWQLRCDPEASPSACALRDAWFQII